MRKHVNKKIFSPLTLTLAIVLIAGLLILFRQPTKISRQTEDNKLANEPKKEFVFDANKYKSVAKELFARLSIDDPSSAGEVKQKLLDLTVSKEFKEVHFDLVMASVSLEKYALSRDKASLDQAKVLLAKLRKNYSWLNDKSL